MGGTPKRAVVRYRPLNIQQNLPAVDATMDLTRLLIYSNAVREYTPANRLQGRRKRSPAHQCEAGVYLFIHPHRVVCA